MRGERLKDSRKKKGLSQTHLAELLGVQPSAVSRWERDIFEPTDETKKKLAEMLGTTVAYLMGESDNSGPVSATHKTKKEPVSEETGELVIIVLPSGRTLKVTQKQKTAFDSWEKDPEINQTIALAATLKVPLSDMVPGETIQGYPTDTHKNLAAVVKLLTDIDPNGSINARGGMVDLKKIPENDAYHILEVIKETLRWKLDQASGKSKSDPEDDGRIF